MPAIVQTLLLLPLLASGLSPKEAGSPGRRSAAVHLAVSVVLLVLFAGCLLTATAPVWNRQTLISAGDFALLSEGRPRDAEAHYRAAAAADRLSPDPPGRLANLHFQQWQSQPSSAAADFEKTVEWQRRAIALDPHSPFGYRGLGEWHLKRFQRTKAAGDASAAVDALTTAVQRYPTSATLRSLLAQALLETGDGDAARRQAEAAMRLDEINRREGHTDKILPDSVRREVEAILRPVVPSSRPVE